MDRLAAAAHRSGRAVRHARSTFDVSPSGAAGHLGHQPRHGRADVNGRVPDPDDFDTEVERRGRSRALEYMGLKPARRSRTSRIDRVFIGSCTNSPHRRPARRRRRGRGATRCADGVRAMVVPGSQPVKRAGRSRRPRQHLQRGRLRVARGRLQHVPGHEPRHPAPGERCASTSNRNFEGRQGKGGRTHLVSPPMAAAAAIAGHFVDIRNWNLNGESSAVMERVSRRVHRGLVAAAGPRQRRHRPDHPQAVPQAHRAHRLRPVPLLRLALPRRRRQPGLRAQPARVQGSADSPRPATTSAAARRASTRPGRCTTTASACVIAPSASPTSSTTTASRTASCPSFCRRNRRRAVRPRPEATRATG